jgi:hypothetical protein
MSPSEANALVASYFGADRLPLRAVLTLQACRESQDETRLALRGGFCSALPKLLVASEPSPARLTGKSWEQFPESFAASCADLANEKCAPPSIVWMPKGVHCIYPNGSPGLIVWQVKPHMALIANRHLQELRAKAARGETPTPFIDLNHDLVTVAGEVTEFFWDPAWGIRASVNWTPAGESAVVSGRFASFSPHWINAGERFLGLRANLGGLLDENTPPAFKLLRQRVLATTKLKALRARAERFLRAVDGRAGEIPDTEFATMAAFEQVKSEQPALYAAYALREALNAEHLKDLLLESK